MTRILESLLSMPMISDPVIRPLNTYFDAALTNSNSRFSPLILPISKLLLNRFFS